MGKVKKVGKTIGMILVGVVLVGLIGHTAFDIYVRMAFEKEVRRIKERGEPASFNDLAEVMVPEEQNAAILYREVFPLIDANKGELDGLREVIRACSDFAEWTEEQKEEVLAVLAKYDEVFEISHEASLRPDCDVKLDYADFEVDRSPVAKFFRLSRFSNTFPLMRFTRLSHLLSLRSALDKEEGQMEEAVERVLDGFAVASAAGTVQCLPSAMTRIACDHILLNRLERLLTDREISEESYRRLHNSLKKQRETNAADFLNSLHVERCAQIMLFEKPLMSVLLPVLPGYRARWPFVTFTRFEILRHLRELTGTIEGVQGSYWEVNDKEIITYSRFLLRRVWLEAQFKVAELAVALRIYRARYGVYPASLNELVPDILQELPMDPFTGKDFAYHREGNGFTVYSLGGNTKDDRGERGELREQSGDVVWKSDEPSEEIALR